MCKARMTARHGLGPLRVAKVVSDPKDRPIPSAETARQEGAQGRAGKGPGDTVSDGEVDASDPVLNDEIAQVADQTHANA